jgi:hypothetical protein
LRRSVVAEGSESDALAAAAILDEKSCLSHALSHALSRADEATEGVVTVLDCFMADRV